MCAASKPRLCVGENKVGVVVLIKVSRHGRYQASSRNYLRGVRVPLFVIQALDDPVLDLPSFVEEDAVGGATVRQRLITLPW